jgi:hypothetical protein
VKKMVKESAYKVKNISVDAVVGCVLGGLSLCCLIGAVITSYLFDGNGPAAVGLLGVAALFLSVVGLAFSICAWKSVDGGLLMKRIAVIVSVIPLVIALGFYIWGWM